MFHPLRFPAVVGLVATFALPPVAQAASSDSLYKSLLKDIYKKSDDGNASDVYGIINQKLGSNSQDNLELVDKLIDKLEDNLDKLASGVSKGDLKRLRKRLEKSITQRQTAAETHAAAGQSGSQSGSEAGLIKTGAGTLDLGTGSSIYTGGSSGGTLSVGGGTLDLGSGSGAGVINTTGGTVSTNSWRETGSGSSGGTVVVANPNAGNLGSGTQGTVNLGTTGTLQVGNPISSTGTVVLADEQLVGPPYIGPTGTFTDAAGLTVTSGTGLILGSRVNFFPGNFGTNTSTDLGTLSLLQINPWGLIDPGPLPEPSYRIATTSNIFTLPEPGSIVLLAVGALGLLGRRRRG